jgi:hypothetical protein
MMPGKKIILFQDILCTAIIVPSVLFLVYFSFFTPRFLVNDDVLIMMNVSGFLTGSPDEHMLFTNVIIGKILKYLYSTSPGFNWYTAYLFSVYYISTIFMLYGLLSLKSSKNRVFLFTIGFVVSEFFMLLYPTFTTASALAAQAGIFLLLTYFTKRSAPNTVIGILLLVLSGMIRYHSSLMMLAASLPLILWMSWENKSLKFILLPGLAILIVIASILYDKSYYHQDKQWANHYDFNQARGQLHQNPRFYYTENTKPFFDRIGWSNNDYLMFDKWFLEDTKIYSKEKLQALLQELRKNVPFRYPSERIYYFMKIISDFRYYLFSNLILFCLCWILIPKNNRKFILFALGSSFFIIGYILCTYYLPPQGFIPFISFVCFTFIFFAVGDMKGPTDSFKDHKSAKKIFLSRKALACVVVIISCIWLWQLHRISLNNKNQQNSLSGLIKSISSQENNLYVTWGADFPFEYISPYSNLTELKHSKIYPLGFFTQSPTSYSILEKYNINNLYTALYLNDNLLLMSSFSKLHFLQTFIKEHYDTAIYFKPLINYNYNNEKMGVYKAIRTDKPT